MALGRTVDVHLPAARPLPLRGEDVADVRLLLAQELGRRCLADTELLDEHALRGAMEENPVGIVPQPGGAMPTVLDPDDASCRRVELSLGAPM